MCFFEPHLNIFFYYYLFESFMVNIMFTLHVEGNIILQVLSICLSHDPVNALSTCWKLSRAVHGCSEQQG